MTSPHPTLMVSAVPYCSRSNKNAVASEKEQFAHTGPVGRVDDVVLNPQIIEQKLDWKIVVRLDAADLCRSENHDGWPLLPEETLHGPLIGQIKLRPIALRQIMETLTFEAAD